MPVFVKKYAKAIVAALLLAVAAVANALGVDTGLDTEALGGVVVTAVLVTLGVYATPNSED